MEISCFHKPLGFHE